jgi:hypothetical protein
MFIPAATARRQLRDHDEHTHTDREHRRGEEHHDQSEGGNQFGGIFTPSLGNG